MHRQNWGGTLELEPQQSFKFGFGAGLVLSSFCYLSTIQINSASQPGQDQQQIPQLRLCKPLAEMVYETSLKNSKAMFNLFKKKDNSTFKFAEPESTACFTCDHVFNRQREILYAVHDGEDGAWQFMCGESDHTESNGKLITLKQATEIDETINDLFEMPLGVGAERGSVKEKWKPFRHHSFRNA